MSLCIRSIVNYSEAIVLQVSLQAIKTAWLKTCIHKYLADIIHQTNILQSDFFPDPRLKRKILDKCCNILFRIQQVTLDTGGKKQ